MVICHISDKNGNKECHFSSGHGVGGEVVTNSVIVFLFFVVAIDIWHFLQVTDK